MSRWRRGASNGGSWIGRPTDMLESPAYRVLSKSGLRLLALLEIELARSDGNGNGRLILTYKQCTGAGMDRHAVNPGFCEVQALGFVECTEKGYSAGDAEHRRPSRYRLTYARWTNLPFSDDWRRIKTYVQAAKIANEARKDANAREARKRAEKKRLAGGGFPTISVGEPPTENRSTSMGETPTTVAVGKPPLLCTSGVRGGERSAPEGSAVASSPPRNEGWFGKRGDARDALIVALMQARGCDRAEALRIFEALPFEASSESASPPALSPGAPPSVTPAIQECASQAAPKVRPKLPRNLEWRGDVIYGRKRINRRCYRFSLHTNDAELAKARYEPRYRDLIGNVRYGETHQAADAQPRQAAGRR